MFSSLTTGLREEVHTIKLVLDAHDSLRVLVYHQGMRHSSREAVNRDLSVPAKPDEHLNTIRRSGLTKPSWQVYDHCAAFTRLYAVYEQFVEDLVSDYLHLLPSLYAKYEDLPVNVKKQHRVGIGQILLKLGKDGPYKHVEEAELVKGWAQGLLGSNYSLFADAFLIDPQNYRGEVLAGLFTYLGIENCWAWIDRHPLMIDFMSSRRDANETAKTLLHDFVEYRNKASHTKVGEIVASEEIKSFADYISVLSEVLSQLVMKRVVQRKMTLGEVTAVGTVLKRFSNFVLGMRMSAGTVARGDQLIVMQKGSCFKTKIVSIQIGQAPYERLDVQDGQEIGLRLDARTNQGAELVRIAQQMVLAQAIEEPISPDDYPIESDSQPKDLTRI